MAERTLSQLLVDRKTLCKLLGGVSISHIIRLEHIGKLAEARIQIGPRVVRYDLKLVQDMISERRLF